MRKPYPEIARIASAKPWRVSTNGPPRTDISECTMQTGTEGNEGECEDCGIDHAHHYETHEMIHAAISPEIDPFCRKYGIKRADAVILAEEIRVLERTKWLEQWENARAVARCHIGPKAPHLPSAGPGRTARIITLLPYYPEMRSRLTPEERQAMDLLQRWAPHNVDMGLVPMAWIVDQMLDEEMKNAHKPPKKGKQEDEKQKDGTTRKGGQVPKPKTGEKGLWGKMKIVTPTLCYPAQKVKGRSPSHASCDYGAVPKRFHRAALDGKLFRRKVPGQSIGTVLIDGSGSMHWTEDQLASILHKAPASTIAVYDGAHGEGDLKILAKNGRRVGPNEPLTNGHGGNEVDGPALDWLGKQKGPRYWISDMGVCSELSPNDNTQLVEYCRRRMDASKITRYGSADQFIRAVCKP